VSPSGSHVALASSSSVTVLSRAEDWAETAAYPLARPLFRIALDDAGLVVGVAADDSVASSTIVLFDGDRRDEQPIGPLTPFTMLLDSARRRVLLAGRTGTGSFHGGGDDFVTLLTWGPVGSAWTSLWDGPAPVDAPNGWLMPLTFGDIAVHDLDRLIIVSPDTNPDDVGAAVDELSLEHLETVVSSPRGDHVAWFWRGDHATCVRSARLADGSVSKHPDLEEIGSFPVIAVADDATVTILDVVRPATIRARHLEDGGVATTTYDLA
jgi:hypothetical protein